MKLSNTLFISILLTLPLLWLNRGFSAVVAQSFIVQNGPDLIITNIDYDPPNPQVGDLVDIKIVVQNQGNQTAKPGFWNYIYLDPVDEPPTEETSIFANVYRGEDLKSNETFTWWGLDYTYTGTDPVIYAVADPSWRNAVINELNEENNMLRFPIQESTQTATPMPTIASDAPDVYELDDTCTDIADEAKIATDGTPQIHNFVLHANSKLEKDIDRIRFDAVAGSTYKVRIRSNNEALKLVTAYDDFCGEEPLTLGNSQVLLTPEENVTYYISISYEDIDQDIDTRYQVQVTESTPESTATLPPVTPILSPTHTPSPTPMPTDSSSTSHKTWAMLIYAVGDNDLARFLDMGEKGMLHRLSKTGSQPNVEVAVMYDGPELGDTVQYLLKEDGEWLETPMNTEAKMDESETLRDFIEWGVEQYPNRDHYILALLDHANGLLGFGQDYTTDKSGGAFLTPQEMRQAIRAGLDNTHLDKFDVIHIDGCSFGLFEDTYIFEEKADYVIASPNTGWSLFPYETYRRLAGESSGPLAYAQSAAVYYADEIALKKYPYTISVYDMAYYQTMYELINNLGKALHSYIEGNTAEVEELKVEWKELQKYDSDNYHLNAEIDRFVDLGHLAYRLSRHENASIADAARAIQSALPDFVNTAHIESEDFIEDYTGASIDVDLDEAQGLAIYYPNVYLATTDMYVKNEIFPSLTQGWGWRDFLHEYHSEVINTPIPPPADISSETMLAPLSLDPISATTVEYKLFMPQVFR